MRHPTSLYVEGPWRSKLERVSGFKDLAGPCLASGLIPVPCGCVMLYPKDIGFHCRSAEVWCRILSIAVERVAGKERLRMSTLPPIILIILAVFTWVVAIVASIGEEPEQPRPAQQKPAQKDESAHERKAA